MKMKIAEALSLRADLQKRIAQLKDRLIANAKVQEGDRVSEDPQALLKELSENICALEELIARINHTNSLTKDAEGRTLTELIARRDALSLHLATLRAFCAEASQKINRYSGSEIRILSTVDVSALQKEIDGMSRDLRQLDTKIQGLNWTCDLL